MGILVNGGDDSSLRVEMPNGDASKMRVPTSRARAWGHPMFLGTRFAVEAGAPDAARGADMAWHVTLKVRSGFVRAQEMMPPGLLVSGSAGLGVLEQTYFAACPCHQVRRPEPMAILHLLAEGRWSWWNGGLPHGWSELEINISSSRDFCNEAGVKYGGYLRRDIRAAMDRDELNGAASSSLGQCRHEIVRNIQTPGGMRVTIEFVFERGTCNISSGGGDPSRTHEWKLVDVVVVALAPLKEPPAGAALHPRISSDAAFVGDENDAGLQVMGIGTALLPMRA